MDRREFWAACQRAPMFKEPGGADWQHPAAMSRGSMGKMGRPVKEFEILWLLCWWVHPAAAVFTKRPYFHPFPFSMCTREMQWVESDNMKLCWSSHKGKCSSQICHSCLCEAVFSSTAYLPWAQTHYVNYTVHMPLSATPLTHAHTPSQFRQCSPYSDRWSKLPGTYSLYYASMLLQQVTDTVGCMLAPLQLLWKVKGEPTIAWCIH